MCATTTNNHSFYHSLTTITRLAGPMVDLKMVLHSTLFTGGINIIAVGRPAMFDTQLQYFQNTLIAFFSILSCTQRHTET